MTGSRSLPVRARAGAVIIFSFATAGLVALSPPDETLGTIVRFLYFHGALTWVNLALFTLAAIVAIAYLLRGQTGAYRWASSFRYIALVYWAINTWMGFESMILVWGGVKWDEPRLRMTFWVMLAALLVFAVDFLFHRWRLTASLDVALAVLVWALLLSTPMEFHPDSPVLHSPPEIIAFFIAMTATSFAATMFAAWLLRDRLGRADRRESSEGAQPT